MDKKQSSFTFTTELEQIEVLKAYCTNKKMEICPRSY